MKVLRLWLALACLLVTSLPAARALTFQDIRFWAGSGTNRAAFEIDWDDGSTNHALAWGYRWNGTATGEQMLKAIIAADARLFAEVSGSTEFGIALFGLGYHQTADGDFRLNPPLTFNEERLALSGYSGLDESRVAVEANDRWQEGWMTAGYWSYYLSTNTRLGTNPEDWDYSGVGMTGRVLSDGDWDGWIFAYDFTGPMPANPVPAKPLSPYAAEVVAGNGPFGPAPYDDPASLLDEPASIALNFDPFIGNSPFHVKLVEPAYNTDPSGRKVITTLDRSEIEGGYTNSAITVKFDHPVEDDPANPYGIDFQVFGNAFYTGDGFASDASDMRTYNIVGAPFAELLLVSVSPDGIAWYTYTNGPFADSAFPTQGYQWDAAQHDATGNGWTTNRMDFTKPVNPALNDVIGVPGKTLPASDAVKLYSGSGGGTGFDLAQSGFRSIRYVRIEASGDLWGGEVDALSDVRPSVLGDQLVMAPGNLTNGSSELFFQEPFRLKTSRLSVRFLALDSLALVSAAQLDDSARLALLPTEALSALSLDVAPALGGAIPRFAAELKVGLAARYPEPGRELDVLIWTNAAWARVPFTLDPSSRSVVLQGVASSTAVAVLAVTPPRLVLETVADVLRFSFTPVAGWRHELERSGDFVNWQPVSSVTPAEGGTATIQDVVPAEAQMFYRLRLVRP